MTKVSFFFLCLFSLSLHAEVIVSYQYGLEGTGNFDPHYDIKKVQVTSDAKLIVTIQEYDGYHDLIINGPSTTTDLDEVSYEKIKARYDVVSASKITYFQAGVICAVVVQPYQMTNHLSVYRTLKAEEIEASSSNGFNSFTPSPSLTPTLVEVLGPQGCWVGSYIYPSDEAGKVAARELKKILADLAI